MSYEWVRQDADDGFYRRARFEQVMLGRWNYCQVLGRCC